MYKIITSQFLYGSKIELSIENWKKKKKLKSDRKITLNIGDITKIWFQENRFTDFLSIMSFSQNKIPIKYWPAFELLVINLSRLVKPLESV